MGASLLILVAGLLPEVEHAGGENLPDGGVFSLLQFRGVDMFQQLGVDAIALGGAVDPQRLGVSAHRVGDDHFVQSQEQPLFTIRVQQLVVDDDDGGPIETGEIDVFTGKQVLILIPVKDAADLAASRSEHLLVHLQAAIGSPLLLFRIVADMACLDDDQILAVMSMRPVAVGGDDTAYHSMVEREGAEVLGDQDDRIALAFVGAEGARRHDAACLEAQ